MVRIPMSALGRAWFGMLLVAAFTVFAGCTQPTDPAELSCRELGPYLVRDLERTWTEVTDPETPSEQNEQESIDTFVAQVRDAQVSERRRSCGNGSALRHSAIFSELLDERRELGLKPFVTAGFGAIDADLRALGEQPQAARSPYSPLPKPAASAIEGNMGKWKMSRVDASIKDEQLVVSVGLPIEPTSQNFMTIYFETKGSNEPDIALSHPIGPSWLDFEQIKGWRGGGTQLTGCTDANSSTLLKFAQPPGPYRVQVPLKCIGNPTAVRINVGAARWDEKAGDYIGLQYYPAKDKLTGWILPD